MKKTFKDIIGRFFHPSTAFLSCISVFFFIVFSFGDGKDFSLAKIFYLLSIFYKNEIFAFLGLLSVAILISRLVEALGFSIKSMEWLENKKRVQKGWPTKEEEVLLESLFYEGIVFDELYKFLDWAFDANYLAFTENGQATTQNYSLLARSDSDKYWLSYFRFSYREPARIRVLYLIISHFMEVLTGDKSYAKELKDQSLHDPELKNIDTEKLLIAIVNKDEIKKYFNLCQKYYKMIIEKRVEKTLNS